MSLDPQWVNLGLLILLIVSQVGRWSKRAEEKTGLDSIRVRLDAVFVSRELYTSERQGFDARLMRIERKIGLNGQRDDR